jgi:hypothetical protein
VPDFHPDTDTGQHANWAVRARTVGDGLAFLIYQPAAR